MKETLQDHRGEGAGGGGAPGVIVGKEKRGAGWRQAAPLPLPWGVLRALGATLALVGALDLGLLWYPAQWGSPEFEFATISRFADGLPVISMGLALLVVSALAAESRRASWVACGLVGAMALLVAVLGLVFLLDVPIALRANLDPTVRLGVKKVIVKTLLELGIWWLLMAFLAFKAYRAAKATAEG